MAIGCTRGLIALRSQRNVDLIELDLHLALCLEDAAWVEVEVAHDQPAQVVTTGARRGPLCSKLLTQVL